MYSRKLTLLLTSSILLVSACQQSPEPKAADLILRGGHIISVDPSFGEVEALAIRDGRIENLGSWSLIRRYAGPDTRVIELEDEWMAMPGFIEGHGHYMRLGETLTQVDLRPAQNWREVVDLVVNAAEEIGPGEWVIGHGWHQGKWERPPEPNVEGLPLHDQLSALTPENPVLLQHVSGHGLFANALAMQLAGIDDETENPTGGEIVRDDDGHAIGMMREDAASLVEAAVAASRAGESAAEQGSKLRRFSELAGDEALRHGITSFQDLGASFLHIDIWKNMATEGRLPLRMYAAVQESSEVMRDRLASYRMIGHGDGFLTVRAIGEKVLDGALGTHGGWLLEPYSDLPRSYGFEVTPLEEILASAKLAVRHKYQMAIQGIGDRAVRELLDIYEASFKSRAERHDWRWRIEHAQVIHPQDLQRFVDLKVIPSVQGIFACSDGLWVTDRLGEQRTRNRGYLFRRLMDMGAVVTNGTDPPVENIDPIASFHCSVTRILPTGQSFFPEQALTREQAIRSYTINNAFAAFEDDVKGSLTPGKYADIVVLSKNLLSVPDHEIMATEVLYTILDGEIRYQRESK